MRLIRQCNELDCGLAVAAMMTSKSYRQARLADPDPHAERGLWVGEMLRLLERLSGASWAASASGRGKVLDTVAPNLATGVTAMVVREPGKKIGHWIVVEVVGFLARGITIFDPEMRRPMALREYARRGWLVVRQVRQASHDRRP